MKREIAQLLVGAASALVVAGSIAACATTAPYGPAATPRSVGYFDQQIESNRFRVSYRGPSGMSRTEVEDLAMLRAADLALEQGYDWFQIIGRYGDLGPPTSPRFSFGIGGSSFGRNSAVGVGTSTGFGGQPSFIANLELMMGRGAKPSTPDAYDARSVANVIRPRAPA
jgi:hypothetical protein